MILPRLLVEAICVLTSTCKGEKQSSTDDYKLREEAKEVARKFNLVDTPGADACELAASPIEFRKKSSPGRIVLLTRRGNDSSVRMVLRNIDCIFRKGIRYAPLTPGNGNHAYAMLNVWRRCSPFGEKIVAEMN